MSEKRFYTPGVEIGDVLAVIEAETGVDQRRMETTTRARIVVMARRLTIWLAYQTTSLSFPEIVEKLYSGRQFPPSHSAAVERHGLMENKYKTEPGTRELLDEMVEAVLRQADKRRPGLIDNSRWVGLRAMSVNGQAQAMV